MNVRSNLTITTLLKNFNDIKYGNNNTNSTSKIKKIKHTIKNRNEKGRRALYLVLNPHSNGLIFSNIISLFLHSEFPINSISIVRIVNRMINRANKLMRTMLNS